MPIIKKPVKLVIVVVLIAILGSCKSDLGDLKTEYREIIVRDGTVSFDKKRRAKAKEDRRGKMLPVSFALKN